VPLQHAQILLAAQLPQNLADLLPGTSKASLLTVLWYAHYVVIVFPLQVGLALPIFHRRSSLLLGPSTVEDFFITTRETAEPVRFSPAEPVD
jgi:hypothetical protein